MGGLVISGGRVVDPASGMDAVGDVAIVDGKIAACPIQLLAKEKRLWGDVWLADNDGDDATTQALDSEGEESDEEEWDEHVEGN